MIQNIETHFLETRNSFSLLLCRSKWTTCIFRKFRSYESRIRVIDDKSTLSNRGSDNA